MFLQKQTTTGKKIIVQISVLGFVKQHFSKKKVASLFFVLFCFEAGVANYRYCS